MGSNARRDIAFSPLSALLGIFVLVPIFGAIGSMLGGGLGLTIGFLLGLAVSIVGSFYQVKAR